MWDYVLLGSVLALCCLLFYKYTRSYRKILYSNTLKNIMILEQKGQRFFVFIDRPRIIQSAYDCRQPLKIVLHYQKLIVVCALCLPSPAQRIAIMGFGCGNLSMHLRRLYPYAVIEHFEKRERLLDYAQRYFHFRPDDNMTFHFGDAIQAFQKGDLDSYDLIIADIFEGDALSPELSSLGFCYAIKKHLSGRGVFLVNTTAQEKGKSVYLNVFEHVVTCSWSQPYEHNCIRWAGYVQPVLPQFKEKAHILAMQGLTEKDIMAIANSILC